MEWPWAVTFSWGVSEPHLTRLSTLESLRVVPANRWRATALGEHAGSDPAALLAGAPPVSRKSAARCMTGNSHTTAEYSAVAMTTGLEDQSLGEEIGTSSHATRPEPAGTALAHARW